MVFLPAGTYKVSPTSGKVFDLPGAVSIMGAGKGLSTIKLANSVGAWDYMFYDASHNLSGLMIADLSVDLNIDNNSIVNLAEILAHCRYTIYLGSGATGSKIRIENIEVKNNSSMNTIVTGEGLSDVTIHGCSFVNKKDGNSISHDHSTLYLISTYNRVTGNYFEGDALPNCTSRCAIETHGSHTTIANNRIVKFGTAVNLTGVSSVEDTTDMTVIGNVADQMQTAFCILWSQTYLTHTTGYGLDGVTISGNVAHIQQTSATVGDVTYGVGIDPNSTLPLRNISINNNVLVFEK